MKIKILFILFPILLLAQKQKIQLIDSTSKEPLQFVEMLYNNNSFFSDRNGHIFINFNGNKLQILDGNYKPNVVEISASTNVIELQSIVNELEELVIAKKPRTIINRQEKGLWDYYYIGSDMISLNEITFNKEYQGKYLRKVSFKTYRNIPSNFDTSVKNKDFKTRKKKLINATQLLRLNIFNENKEIIYNSTPIEYNSLEKHSFDIDILDDILITNKPIFIEIQVIGFLDETGEFADYYASVRPQQIKKLPNEYKVKTLSKKRGTNQPYSDLIEHKILKESYINFGFEFEDAE